MTIYTDSTLQPIYEGQGYTSLNGTQYPSGFPLGEIEGLNAVNETEQPVDAELVVTGFMIDENFNQVWQTRKKTAEEMIPPAPPIPRITLKQAKLALLNRGILSQVNSLLTNPPPDTWWEYSASIERNNPILIDVATRLRLSSVQIDKLFEYAATL